MSFVDRLFRPETKNLDAALRLVQQRSPADAWRVLHEAERLEASWLDDPNRRFPAFPGMTPRDREQSLRMAPYVPHEAHPDSAAECALVAARQRSMERAEEHARAFVRWLASSGTGPAMGPAILWVPTSAERYDYQTTDTKPGVWEPHPPYRNESIADVRAALGLDGSGDGGSVVWWAYAAKRWEEDGFNPYAQALAVFTSGYALLPSNEDFVVLGYPGSGVGTPGYR
ncbi:MAG: hypothetical protein AAGE52_15555 [Myxococcota bacterium]